jgi:hypothetical protein
MIRTHTVKIFVYEQQCPQRVRTHPIMYLARIPLQLTRYAAESGAHADQNQDRWHGQYI